MPPQVRRPAAHNPASLAGSPLLASMPVDDLRELVRAGRERRWRAGELLFQRGDPGDGIYAVVSGEVRIVLEGRNGAEVLVRRLRDGDVFGEMSVFDGAPRSATAVASTDVRALHIAADRFRQWVRERPAVAERLLEVLAHRLRTTSDQVAEIALTDVATRVAAKLRQRFEQEAGGQPGRGQRMRVNQGEMAAVLGVTRESVNKHLARLKERKVIALDRGWVELRDPAALDRATELP